MMDPHSKARNISSMLLVRKTGNRASLLVRHEGNENGQWVDDGVFYPGGDVSVPSVGLEFRMDSEQVSEYLARARSGDPVAHQTRVGIARIGTDAFVGFPDRAGARIRLVKAIMRIPEVLPPPACSMRIGAGPNGVFALESEINGIMSSSIIDTGASTLTVTGAVARDAGLERLGKQSVRTAAGSVTMERTLIPDFRIGPFRRSRVSALISDHEDMPCLIGQNVLSSLDMRISAGDLLIAEPAPPAPSGFFQV